MEGFVGRERELRVLEDLYMAAPQSCAVYGRMRLGKTALLKKFCEFKRHIYVSGSDGLESDIMRVMSDALCRYTGEKERLDDPEDFFKAIKRVCVRRTVVILDHYSQLLDTFPDFYNLVNRFVSRDIRETRVLLVACDTDLSVLGRFPNQFEVRSMSYLDCVGFHHGFSPMQHLQAYGMVGGTPAYQYMIREDPMEAVRKLFLDDMSVLSLESESLVNGMPLRKVCVKILSAMATGADSMRGISTVSGVSQSVCNRVINDMENNGLVTKEVAPMNSRNWTCTFYSNILRFYFSVVAESRMLPDFYTTDKAYEKAKGLIPGYMEGIFKSVCAEYIRIRCGAKSTMRVRSNSGDVVSDVDYVATVTDEKGKPRAAMVVCRLNGDPFNLSDLNRMVFRSKAFKSKNVRYMMFSACGFTDELKKARLLEGDLVLRTLEEVYEPVPAAEGPSK